MPEGSLLQALVPGGVLISRAVASQVPSALRGLTSVFGMGTGGTLLLSSPELRRCAPVRWSPLSRLTRIYFTPSKPHSEKLTSKTSFSIFLRQSLLCIAFIFSPLFSLPARFRKLSSLRSDFRLLLLTLLS